MIMYIFAKTTMTTPMKILYSIYQVCFALPLLLILTILTALVTIIGSLTGGAHQER